MQNNFCIASRQTFIFCFLLSSFSRTLSRPFRKPTFELEVSSATVPCEIDFEFVLRAVGINGRATQTK